MRRESESADEGAHLDLVDLESGTSGSRRGRPFLLRFEPGRATDVRITRVEIRSFRSIETAEVDMGPFNVFVGQNNHGKTNLFEAIEWFYNGGGNLAEIAYLRGPAHEVSVEIRYAGVQEGIEGVKNEKIKESFRKFANGKDELRVIRRGADPSKRALWADEAGEWSTKNFAGFDKAFNDCLPRLQYVSTTTRLADVSKFGKRTPVGEMLSGVLTAILETSPKYQEFREKFDQLFGADESEVRVELNRLGEQVRAHLRQQFPECSSVSFEVSEPGFDDLLKSFATSLDDGVNTRAEEKGDGMQRALMLAIIKTYSDYRRDKDELGKRFLFLIDEAELHLHPTAQRQLKEALRSLADAGDQVLLNTHSSVLIADDHAGQALWQVEKRDRTTRVTAITPAEKPQVVFELLGGSPSDLLFPTNFLIVEGRSEFEFLTRVIRRFYGDRPRLQIIFASGDLIQQERSMNAINMVFTPLYQTPIYRGRLVVLCDLRNAEQEEQYENFIRAYPEIHGEGRLAQLPTRSIEEYYPGQWRRIPETVREMTPRQKTDLAKEVGDMIDQQTFEEAMTRVFRALERAWERAYQ
jgi:recombinational DNA repair ATPase RecF